MIPDFSKRLTTESGRVEHNNPGPGTRTSISAAEKAEMTEASKKNLTFASSSDTISEVGSQSQITDNPSPASPEPQRTGDRPLPVTGQEAQPTSGDTNA